MGMNETGERVPVMRLFSLEGKVAVVTGGAGFYGRQLVDGLLEAGAATVVASRNVESLEALASDQKKRGYELHVRHLDQGSEESIQKLFDQVQEEFGRVDVLVNNAVLRPMKDWNGDLEAFRKSLEVNITGVFQMTRLFGERMGEQGGGSIVNIGSIQGMVGPDFTLYEGLDWGIPPDYFIHKGAMLQLTRFAASRLGPKGVRVNTVSPGGYYTGQHPDFVKRYNARTFLGRMAGDNDLKGAVAFLASDAAAYITGANLPVDAGYTAK
jgi:NAD(P)-dependent dehydrogenase (short-subunit alcohol dehydrogenase family)